MSVAQVPPPAVPRSAEQLPDPLPDGSSPETPAARPTLKESLELGGKAMLGLAGLCYVLGLVVVTVHLNRLGLNSLALSQLQYIMAGVWALLPIIVGMFLTIVAIYSVSDESQRQSRERAAQNKSVTVQAEAAAAQAEVDATPASTQTQRTAVDASAPEKETAAEVQAVSDARPSMVKRIFTNAGNAVSILFSKRIREMVVSLFSLLFGFVVLISWFAGWAGLRLTRWWLVALLLGALVGWMAVFIGYSLPGRLTRATTLGTFNETMVVIFFFFLFFFGYALLFARKCYPEIPWSTGGGKPSTVRFILQPEFSSYFAALGTGTKLDPNSAEVLTGQMSLIMATDKEFIVVVGSNPPVRLASDAVKLVVYEK